MANLSKEHANYNDGLRNIEIYEFSSSLIMELDRIGLALRKMFIFIPEADNASEAFADEHK